MDPLGNPLPTHPIQTGWEFSMEPYPSGQFGFIDDPDHQFGNSSIWNRTRTRSDGPEPLLTLGECEGERKWKKELTMKTSPIDSNSLSTTPQ